MQIEFTCFQLINCFARIIVIDIIIFAGLSDERHICNISVVVIFVSFFFFLLYTQYGEGTLRF